MNRNTPFSYLCNACGRCCHNKVITLSPYDVLRLARAANVTTAQAVANFTIRRGSILKFSDLGACVALEGVRCGVHSGRPLACRLYPLGIEHRKDGIAEKFVALEPAAGSPGVYGDAGVIGDFLVAQQVGPHLEANAFYASLLPIFRDRIAATVDFDRIEPREFWRHAVREALAESGHDPNPLIDEMFDADGAARALSDDETVSAHIDRIAAMLARERNPELLASAAVMLAVSLGYAPADVIFF